jgi:Ribonuclease G/E
MLRDLASSKGISMDEPTIDRPALERLAKALVFICGADHPTTVALRTAAERGSERDLKAARAAFAKLKPSDRRAALAMIGE